MLLATGMPRRSTEESSTSSTLVCGVSTCFGVLVGVGWWVRGNVQKRRGMEHAHDARNNVEALGRHLEPLIERGDELAADIFAWVPIQVVEGPHEYALLLQ